MDIVAKHIPADTDGVRIATLDEMTYRRTLWTHEPIRDFWRIGAGTARKLHDRHIDTMGDLARASLHRTEELYRLFQGAAEELIDHAWGYEPCTLEDIKAYRPKHNSLSQGQVLHEPYPFEKALLICKEMTELLVLDLVAKELLTAKITLTIGYDRCNLTRTVSGKSYTGKTHGDHYGRQVPMHSHGTTNLGHYTASGRNIQRAVAAVQAHYEQRRQLSAECMAEIDHILRELQESPERPVISVRYYQTAQLIPADQLAEGVLDNTQNGTLGQEITVTGEFLRIVQTSDFQYWLSLQLSSGERRKIFLTDIVAIAFPCEEA